MGAVPKRKISRHRRGNRRQHLALTAPSLTTCQNCGELMRSHHACRNCGYYRGRQVIEVRNRSTNERS